jgi:hypothetical protein
MSSNRKSDPKEGLEPSAWISQAAAAHMRGISRQAIADLVARKRLRTLEIGGKILVHRADIEKFTPKPPGPAPKAKKPTKQKKMR